MGADVNDRHSEQDELLLLIPDYRAGRLSPAQAHKISLLLEEDSRFRADAEREARLVEALTTMKETPLPRGLVTRSVRAAVGESATASWFSLDTLLIALGVGVACAATAQFLSGQVNLIPTVGRWLGELVGVTVEGSLGSLLGGVGIVSAALVLGGVFWAVRLLRTRT